MRTTRTILSFAAIVSALALAVWVWCFWRVYVPPGNLLVLNSRFGRDNPDPAIYTVVDEGVKGIQRKVYGEGRYFINPITYTTETHHLVVEIAPLEVGVVESQWGKQPVGGSFLVNEGERGILREVLTPGRHRINPYAYRVTKAPAVVIKPGFVGCVISQTGEDPPDGKLAEEGQKGIQRKVLQPGIYYMNPKAFQVVAVEVGYRVIDFEGVKFPSKDGFEITLETTVVWGLRPENVPVIIGKYGNVEDVIQKIVRPQVESICRIEGSEYGARDFIEGSSREKFQDSFREELEKVCHERYLDVLLALIRNIEVPDSVRQPIQQTKIALEEQTTKKEQGITQTVSNELKELKADVEKGQREVDAETDKIVASLRAEGERSVANIQAQMKFEVSQIMLEVARVEAAKEVARGTAEATVDRLRVEAQADRLKQLATALGTPGVYASYEFVRNLPADFSIVLRYAGEGTLWTDMGNAATSLKDLAAIKILQGAAGGGSSGQPAAEETPVEDGTVTTEGPPEAPAY